jgi:hypothetical protein
VKTVCQQQTRKARPASPHMMVGTRLMGRKIPLPAKIKLGRCSAQTQNIIDICKNITDICRNINEICKNITDILSFIRTTAVFSPQPG